MESPDISWEYEDGLKEREKRCRWNGTRLMAAVNHWIAIVIVDGLRLRHRSLERKRRETSGESKGVMWIWKVQDYSSSILSSKWNFSWQSANSCSGNLFHKRLTVPGLLFSCNRFQAHLPFSHNLFAHRISSQSLLFIVCTSLFYQRSCAFHFWSKVRTQDPENLKTDDKNAAGVGEMIETVEPVDC